MDGSAKIDKCNIKAAKQRTITPPKFRHVKLYMYSLMRKRSAHVQKENARAYVYVALYIENLCTATDSPSRLVF